MSKTKGKIFSALIAVFVVGLILYEGYIWSSGQVKTEKATSIHIDSTYHASGIVIRDETAVTGVSGGALDFIVADGEKVAKNTIIATVYENEEAASLQAQIQSLEDTISQLEAGLDSDYAFTNDVAQLEEEVQKVLYELAEDGQNGADKQMASSYAIINQLRNKKLSILGKNDGLEAELEALRTQKSELEAQAQGAYQHITAPSPGYFIKQLDGYEQAFSSAALEQLTPLTLDTAIAQINAGEGAVLDENAGKIMTEFRWYYVFNISEEEAKHLKPGQSANISFSFDTSNALAATIERISTPEAGKCMLVLKSDVISEDMLYVRAEEAQIVWKNYSGIDIDAAAVRVVDGESGVFCRVGNRAVFKKIDIVYEQDDFVVSAQHTDDKDYVQLYDDVIIQGKDLYDGKLL